MHIILVLFALCWGSNKGGCTGYLTPLCFLSRSFKDGKPSSSNAAEVAEKRHVVVANEEQTGWQRIRSLYTTTSMERDCTERVGRLGIFTVGCRNVFVQVTRMAFISGFLLGGASSYAQAYETYERSNVGRKYLSKSDAFVSLFA